MKTRILCSIFFFENRAVYEIMWGKNIVEPGSLEMTMWRNARLKAHMQNM
jgi:hypothetical protein